MSLLDHEANCTPLTPCTACEIVMRLRAALPPEVFEEIRSLAGKLRDRKGSSAPLPESAGVDELRLPSTLSNRTLNCLKNAGIKTVGDAVKQSQMELIRLPNFGRKSVNELVEALALAGYSLRERGE